MEGVAKPEFAGSTLYDNFSSGVIASSRWTMEIDGNSGSADATPVRLGLRKGVPGAEADQLANICLEARRHRRGHDLVQARIDRRGDRLAAAGWQGDERSQDRADGRAEGHVSVGSVHPVTSLAAGHNRPERAILPRYLPSVGRRIR